MTWSIKQPLQSTPPQHKAIEEVYKINRKSYVTLLIIASRCHFLLSTFACVDFYHPSPDHLNVNTPSSSFFLLPLPWDAKQNIPESDGDT